MRYKTVTQHTDNSTFNVVVKRGGKANKVISYVDLKTQQAGDYDDLLMLLEVSPEELDEVLIETRV